jgi:serine/threonine protein kinase
VVEKYSKDGHEYAIKISNFDLENDNNLNMQNALTEARIMAGLIHPNIIKFKEVIIDNKKLFFVQEYTNYINVEQLIA